MNSPTLVHPLVLLTLVDREYRTPRERGLMAALIIEREVRAEFGLPSQVFRHRAHPLDSKVLPALSEVPADGILEGQTHRPLLATRAEVTHAFNEAGLTVPEDIFPPEPTRPQGRLARWWHRVTTA